MKGIVRIPKEQSKSLTKRSRSGQAASKLKTIREDTDEPDFAGWDDTTDPNGLVWDYVTGKEVNRRAFSFIHALIVR